MIPQIDDEHTSPHGELTVLTADAAPHAPAVILPHATAAYLAERADLLTQAAWVVSRSLPTYQGERGRILAEHLAMLTASLRMLADLAVCDAATLAAQLVATSGAPLEGAALPIPTPPPAEMPAPRRLSPATSTPRRRAPRSTPTATRERKPAPSRNGSAQDGQGGHAA